MKWYVCTYVKAARQEPDDGRWAALARDDPRGLAEGAGNLRALYVDSLQNRVRKRCSAGLWQVEEVSSRAHRHGGRARHEGAPDLLRTSHIQNPHAPSTSTHVLARMLILLVLLLGGHGHGGTRHTRRRSRMRQRHTWVAPSTLRVGTSRKRLDLLALPRLQNCCRACVGLGCPWLGAVGPITLALERGASTRKRFRDRTPWSVKKLRGR